MTRLAGCLVVLMTLCTAASGAETVEQFYKGRSIRLVVGSSVGGGTDIMARLLARTMGRYIPGNPSIVVENQPGGGGLVGANRIANTTDRDGTTFATMERAIPQFAIMGDPNARFDPLQLTWIGSLSSYRDDAFMLLVNADVPIRRAEDLRGSGKSIHVGASQQGSTNLTFALIAKEVLGMNIETISGYAGSAKIALAMQAGEVDGELIGIVSMQASQRQLWTSGRVRPLMQFARNSRHPVLPDVPTGRELLRDADSLALLQFAELPFFMAQSFVAPAGVPPERARALRAAFMLATRDPEYRDAALKLEIDNSPIDHLAIEQLLRAAADTPKPVIDQFAALVARH